MCVCVRDREDLLVSVCLHLHVYISQVCLCVHLCAAVCVGVCCRAAIFSALIWCLGRSIERWSGVRVIADLVGQSMTLREGEGGGGGTS